MASALVGMASSAAFGEKLLACVGGHGSAAHPYPTSRALLGGPQAARNLSDAVHFLCMLHGRHPGVVDHAAKRSLDPAARAWFAANTNSFAAERAFLTRIAVAAGPIPSTPAGRDTEATVIAQRHAIEMLAQSERNGCAFGAAVAVIVDWFGIRHVLNAAAQRFGVEAPPYGCEDKGSVIAFARGAAATPAMERAMLFGAEQIAVQHFGLWELLEARQQARAS